VLVKDKHSSLMESFASYEEIEVLWIQLQELYSQHFNIFVTCNWFQ
jgi:hypothetical protein